MHVSLRKEVVFPLAILVFSLLGSAYVVLAQGQTTSQSDRVSGMCYIRTAHTNAPGPSGPKIGNGYAKVVKPGVYTIEELRVVCTKADYDNLIDRICAKNPYDTEQYMGGEVSDNVSTIGGCTAPGCEIIRRCPTPPTSIKFKIGDRVQTSKTTNNAIADTLVWATPTNGQSPINAQPKGAKGTIVDGSVYANGYFWWQVDYDTGVDGWSVELYLEKTAITAPPPPPASEKTFTYPISELGGCSDAKKCHAYCEKPENNRACFGFVKKHKLIPKDELDKWEEFLDVATGGGPGGCKDEKECINYCEDASHIVECTDFVAKHNLVSPQQLAEMQKVAKALKAGAKLPGNCRNKISCISYCEDSAHTEECVSFLEKGGFMTEKEAGLVRKFKGKSPGDCAKGKESFAEAQVSCNAFCNDPTNQPICFRFLEEAGIMTAEEATQAGSMSDFQACIPSAPDEIKQCFTDNLGPELYEAMQRGVMPLEENIEDFMTKIRGAKKCVNRYTNQALSTFTDNPEALACIDSKLGKDYLEKAKRGEVKCGDAAQSQKKIESCIETAISAKLDHCFSLACSEATTCLKGFGNMGNKRKKEEINPDTRSKIETKINTCVAEQIRGCLSKDCPEMMTCIDKLQEEGGEQKGEGGLDPTLEQEMTVKMTACTKSEQQGREPPSQEQPAAEQTPQQAPQPGGQIPQEYCSGFASVPSCSYVGSPDSENYKYCKQCFPDK